MFSFGFKHSFNRFRFSPLLCMLLCVWNVEFTHLKMMSILWNLMIMVIQYVNDEVPDDESLDDPMDSSQTMRNNSSFVACQNVLFISIHTGFILRSWIDFVVRLSLIGPKEMIWILLFASPSHYSGISDDEFIDVPNIHSNMFMTNWLNLKG